MSFARLAFDSGGSRHSPSLGEDRSPRDTPIDGETRCRFDRGTEPPGLTLLQRPELCPTNGRVQRLRRADARRETPKLSQATCEETSERPGDMRIRTVFRRRC